MVTAVLNVTVYFRSPIHLTVIIGGSYVPIHKLRGGKDVKNIFFIHLVSPLFNFLDNSYPSDYHDLVTSF